ncbi:hypothetical protein [Nocardiopsis sp. NPDC055824]
MSDLSQQFGPAAAGGIGKLAKRTGPTAPPKEPSYTEPEVENDTYDDDIDLTEADGSWEDSAPPSERDDAFPVAVYLLPDVARKLTKLRRSTHKTNADLGLDAIDHWHRRGQLGKLIAQRQVGPRKRPKDSLFPERRGGGRATTGQHRKLWTLQATLPELEIIDGLVEKFEANSRSELVSVALEARYGTKARKSAS